MRTLRTGHPPAQQDHRRTSVGLTGVNISKALYLFRTHPVQLALIMLTAAVSSDFWLTKMTDPLGFLLVTSFLVGAAGLMTAFILARQHAIGALLLGTSGVSMIIVVATIAPGATLYGVAMAGTFVLSTYVFLAMLAHPAIGSTPQLDGWRNMSKAKIPDAIQRRPQLALAGAGGNVRTGDSGRHRATAAIRRHTGSRITGLRHAPKTR